MADILSINLIKREKEENLAEWCEEQKIAYRNGELEQSKIDQLESLEYWTWN